MTWEYVRTGVGKGVEVLLREVGTEFKIGGRRPVPLLERDILTCGVSCFYDGLAGIIWLQIVFAMATSVDAKLLRQTKFPLEFSQKVDMQKVNVEVMKK